MLVRVCTLYDLISLTLIIMETTIKKAELLVEFRS